MFPKPVSNPKVGKSFDTTVTFEIPPIFCTRTFLFNGLNHFSSAKQTSGAPSPPAAISASLKLEIVKHPVSRAITELSPTCKVLFKDILSNSNA